MLSTLQQVRHYVRTAYRDSTTCFDAGASVSRVHGIGQGNGIGPAIWALLSMLIFNQVRKRGYGVFLKTALSGELYHFMGYAFVDDCDLCVTDNPDEPKADSIHTIMQASLRSWDNGIWASGGALVPSKSH